MSQDVLQVEPMVVWQVYPRWAITVPVAFDHTFVEIDRYWHAWDERRSVALTSVVISDHQGRPVSAARIVRQLPAERGERIALPEGLDGWAVIVTPPQPARASRSISGIIAVDGGALLATVTSDDVAWARTVWLSIRRCPTPRTLGEV